MKNNFVIESQKPKLSEEVFYDNFGEYLKGESVEKIAPFDNLNFDLLYLEDEKVAIFKFIDTTEEIFDILGDEIVEIIEEENAALQNNLKEVVNAEINYFVFMPFVDLTGKDINSSNIIDKSRMLEIKVEQTIAPLLSKIDISIEELKYLLAKENYLINDLTKDKKVQLEDAKIYELNNLSYGSTLIEGTSGTGKTTFLVSALFKVAKIYPKEKFLYITFDKYLKGKIKKYFISLGIKNVKVVNFHQFVVMLGKKYNLRLNINSKKSFATEFEKIFNKVSSIYKNKRFFKGIFVDEAENLGHKELKFLYEISYSSKNMFYVSFDERKRLVSKNDLGVEEFDFDRNIFFKKNYRNSSRIVKFNKKYQKLINQFSALEVGELGKYFLDFTAGSKKQGNMFLYKYKTDDIDEYIVNAIKEYVAKGYDYSDICIIFPYNNNKLAKGFANSRERVQSILRKENIDYIVVDDNLVVNKQAVLISNIFNCININPKIVIFCQLETLYDSKEDDEIKRLLNIIYIATSRPSDELHILIKEDETRPSSIDLLEQSYEIN